MVCRVGLVYLPGSLPCFESFGNLPTDLVCADGLVSGKPASEVLDMIVVPGGSLVESGSINGKVADEIVNMADLGKFVLGICSGFQVLSRRTDIGRLSAVPILREGFGLLDVDFRPLICTDQAQASIVGSSFLTSQVGGLISCFHCHTYGDIVLHGDAKPVLVSHVERLNYRRKPGDLISGVSNKAGNVVGVLGHGVLDNNSVVLDGVMKSLGIGPDELVEVRRRNAKLLGLIKGEVGVSSGVFAKPFASKRGKGCRMVLFTALESGSGKTFIVTGLAGALKKRGVNVGVVKIGGDIRDVVPALYLIKEPIRDYSSLMVADCGWMPHSDVARRVALDYDLVLIEGAMDSFTGILYGGLASPRSTAEIAASLGVPTVVVVGCDKEGIEGGLVGGLNYVSLLKSLGVRVVGVVLNRLSLGYLTDEIKAVILKAFCNAGVELLGIVPRVDVEGRGAIPEVEIKYEVFGGKALEVAERYLDVDLLLRLAASPDLRDLDYEAFWAKFRESLFRDFRVDSKK